ncbi:MAG TPA: TonB-dependent siderophore receptor [Povalibacter sp.]|nr:TonB-dependent siderophore receptor [Povalibacter sp.]
MLPFATFSRTRNTFIPALILACSPPSVVAADALEEVIVVGSQVRLPEEFAGGQVARGGRVGLLGNLDMMDVPFTGTSYTADLIRNQQAKSVADVLQNDPVVRVAKGFGNFQELYVIRGFPVFSDDMTYNGIYGILPRQYVAAELLERVEVFRGANTFLNGAAPGGSGVGGAFNLVPKRAGDTPLTAVTLGFENAGQGYGALDLGRRFGADGSRGLRMNLVRRDGETSIDNQDRELTVVSVGTDYRGERLRLAADVGYQDHHIDAPRPGVTPFSAIPSPPDASGNFAQPWTYTDEQQVFGVVRAEYDFTTQFSAWAAVGARNGEEANVLSNPSALPNGDTFAYRFDNKREDDIVSADIGVRAEFDTGSVGHLLIASASAISSESRNAYAFSNFAGFAGNLYHPTAVPAPAADFFTGGSLSSPHVTEENDNSSVALADMLSFLDGEFLLTLGARHQTIKTRTFDYNTGAEVSSYDESRVTPIAALVYKANDHVSVYGNYVEGLVPGEIAPAFSGVPVSNAGEAFKPYRAQQFEIGVKVDRDDFGGSASLFQISRPSAFVENGVFAVDGEQRNRGLELSVFGQPWASLRLLGGVTFIDATMTRTQGGAFNGKDAVGVPDAQANLNVEWHVAGASGLVLEGRAIYTASQFADSANAVSVDSWTRFDLGARYATAALGRPTTLRARIENVADNDYWASVGGYPGSNYLVLGSPRTFVLSASVDF